MGWIPSMDGMKSDPHNVVEPEFQDYFYLSNHKFAIHRKILAGLIHASNHHLSTLQHLVRSNKLSDSIKIEEKQALWNSTRVTVLLNPRHYTAWNTRKLLILSALESSTFINANFVEEKTSKDDSSSQNPSKPNQEILSLFDKELRLISLAFSKQPKTVEAWAHRNWLLRTQSNYCLIDIDREVKICDSTANQHKRNYYTWTHRLFLLRWIKQDHSLLATEFQKAWKWLITHITDASAAHHVAVVLGYISKQYLGKVIQEVYDLPGELDPTSALYVIISETQKYLEIYEAGETWVELRKAIIFKLIQLEMDDDQNDKDAKVEKIVERLISEARLVLTLSHKSSLDRRYRLLIYASWILNHLASHNQGEKSPSISKPLSSTQTKLHTLIASTSDELSSLGWKPSFCQHK